MIDWAEPFTWERHGAIVTRWRTGLTATYMSPFGVPSILLNGETSLSKISAFAVEKGAYQDTPAGRRYCVEVNPHIGPQMMTIADIAFWL